MWKMRLGKGNSLVRSHISNNYSKDDADDNDGSDGGDGDDSTNSCLTSSN